jgi:hypothetical protein
VAAQKNREEAFLNPGIEQIIQEASGWGGHLGLKRSAEVCGGRDIVYISKDDDERHSGDAGEKIPHLPSAFFICRCRELEGEYTGVPAARVFNSRGTTYMWIYPCGIE